MVTWEDLGSRPSGATNGGIGGNVNDDNDVDVEAAWATGVPREVFSKAQARDTEPCPPPKHEDGTLDVPEAMVT